MKMQMGLLLLRITQSTQDQFGIIMNSSVSVKNNLQRLQCIPSKPKSFNVFCIIIKNNSKLATSKRI